MPVFFSDSAAPSLSVISGKGTETGTNDPGTMPVVVASQHSTMDDGQEVRDEAYRMVAELLVGFRRIVHRALVRVCGNEWFERGCPQQVRRRILEQQEVERGVDRCSPDADDLFGQATFADLADIVEFLEPLAVLLRPLAPSRDRLCADLRTLEELRLKVAGARAVSETDQTVLVEMRLRLREKLASARRRTHPDEEDLDEIPEAAERAPDAEVITQEIIPEVAPEVTREIEPEITADITVPGDLPAVEPAAGSVARVEDAPAAAPTPARRIPPTVVGRRAAVRRPIELVDQAEPAVLGGAPTPVGLVQVEQDDAAVLRELRREIIAVAEAAYAHADRIAITVWTGLWDSGWFSRKMERYGLGEVATFYAVIEQYLERRGKGYDRETMKTFFADRELAKILLRLRELFLRLRV